MIIFRLGRLAISWLKPVPLHVAGQRPSAVVIDSETAGMYEPLTPGTLLYLPPPKEKA